MARVVVVTSEMYNFVTLLTYALINWFIQLVLRNNANQSFCAKNGKIHKRAYLYAFDELVTSAMFFYNVTQRHAEHQQQRAFKRCLPCKTKPEAIVLRNAEIGETSFQHTDHEKDMIRFKYSEFSCFHRPPSFLISHSNLVIDYKTSSNPRMAYVSSLAWFVRRETTESKPKRRNKKRDDCLVPNMSDIY